MVNIPPRELPTNTAGPTPSSNNTLTMSPSSVMQL
jgi:hypothetical protein